MSFEDFFITVNKLMMELPKNKLKYLNNVVKSFADTYKNESVAYLCDDISKEVIIQKNFNTLRKYTESNYKQYIIAHFSDIFPEYHYIGTEVPVDKIGYIDILAKNNSGKFVIIELKIKNKNPNTQLLSYGLNYNNPILIGITEEKLGKRFMLPNVTYLTYSDIIPTLKDNNLINVDEQKGENN